MRTCEALVLSLLLFLLPLPVKAQWSGGLDLAGGFGMTVEKEEDDEGQGTKLLHELGQGSFQLSYKNSKFQWNTSLRGSYELRETDSYRLSLDTDPVSGTFQMDEIQKFNQKKPYSVTARTGVLWTPAPGRSYESWILYNLAKEEGVGATFKSHYEGGLDDISESENLYVEIPRQTDHRIQAGFRTSHQLGSPRKVLRGEISLEHDARDKEGLWIMGAMAAEEEDFSSFNTYRITPKSGIQVVNASIHYADSVFTTGSSRLLLDPGFRFMADYTRDRNSGATLIESTEEWRDSTRLRETFNFLAVRMEPYLAADYSWKDLRIHMDYSPQFYARRLTDDTHTQHLRLKRPYLVGNALISWQINPKHRISLRNTITIRHPDYIQICWYERQGNYLTQIYRGKESLLSTQTRAYQLEYAFRYKRFLSTTVTGYTARTNEIDQTFSNETIDGREYQVFTWVNAADSRILSFSQQFGWRGRILQASIGVSNNGTTRKPKAGGEPKRSADWRGWADATLTLPHGWTLATDVSYRSNVSTFFTLFSQYCALNARVQKNFKRFNVYLQGRDLLDNVTSVKYFSEDGYDGWVEETRQNRRMVVLGFQWRF